MPRKPPPKPDSPILAFLKANPFKVALAVIAGMTTLLGILPAWWAVEDHFWLRREAVKQIEDHKDDLSDLHKRMERSRLWAEHSRLESNRQRLEKAVRDAAYRQSYGARLSPAEKLSLEADQADLTATVNAIAEVKRQLNR